MATYSSILAWEIPWTEEHSWPQSMHLQVRHNLATKQQHQGQETNTQSENFIKKSVCVCVCVCIYICIKIPKRNQRAKEYNNNLKVQ